jgi:hypothetical protein
MEGTAGAVTVDEDAMGFLSRTMRFLFWLIIVSWSVALLRRVVAWMLRGVTAAPQPGSSDGSSTKQSATPARLLVRDPVCGVHVAEVLSIPLRQGAGTLHFCSIACRDQYLESTKKLAANG